MKRQVLSIKSAFLGMSLALSSCVHSAPEIADFNEVNLRAAILLQSMSYYKTEFDEKLSARIFDLYIKKLDANKLYFLQSDIDEFSEKYRTTLCEKIITKKSINVANEIFARMQHRVEAREKEVDKLLANNTFAFDSQRVVYRDRDKVDWATTEEEIRLIWQNRAEALLLSEDLRRTNIAKLAAEQGKPNPLEGERAAIESVKLKFKRDFKAAMSLDEEDIATMMIASLSNAFGPHTDYHSARQMEQFTSSISTRLVGVGAVLQTEEDGATKINGIIINGPTDKQGGIQLGDRIIGVDSLDDGKMVDIMFMPLNKVVELIRGKEGTPVRLKVEPAKNPAAIKEIVIERASVELKNDHAVGKIIDVKKDGKIQRLGMIKLPSFYSDFQNPAGSHCARDVKNLVTRMNKEGIEGLLLDLRNNGGGSLDEVRKMAGFFIGHGPVVSVFAIGSGANVHYSEKDSLIYDGPLIVSIDKSSASASEILAGVLQDYNRAVIVGDSSTFGKGTVQQHFDLKRYLPSTASRNRAGFLKPTIQKFYRVAGSSTQLKGVESDIVLPSVFEGLDVGEAYLDYALPHDSIQPAKGFSPQDRSKLNIAYLKGKSAQRIANSIDYQYMQEDSERLKDSIAENSQTINKVDRQNELAENQMRLKARNKERIIRFKEIQKQDVEMMDVYRLQLDDLENDHLVKLDLTNIEDTYLRSAKSDLEDLDETPEWPSQINLHTREEINILSDLISVSKVKKPATVNK